MKTLCFPITNYNRTYTTHTNAMSASPVVMSDRCTYTDKFRELFTAELILIKEEEEMAKSGSNFFKKDKQRSTTAMLSIKSSSTSVGLSSFQEALLHQRTLYCKRLQNIGPSIESNPGKRCRSIVGSPFQTLSTMMSKIPQK